MSPSSLVSRGLSVGSPLRSPTLQLADGLALVEKGKLGRQLDRVAVLDAPAGPVRSAQLHRREGQPQTAGQGVEEPGKELLGGAGGFEPGGDLADHRIGIVSFPVQIAVDELLHPLTSRQEAQGGADGRYHGPSAAHIHPDGGQKSHTGPVHAGHQQREQRVNQRPVEDHVDPEDLVGQYDHADQNFDDRADRREQFSVRQDDHHGKDGQVGQVENAQPAQDLAFVALGPPPAGEHQKVGQGQPGHDERFAELQAPRELDPQRIGDVAQHGGGGPGRNNGFEQAERDGQGAQPDADHGDDS